MCEPSLNPQLSTLNSRISTRLRYRTMPTLIADCGSSWSKIKNLEDGQVVVCQTLQILDNPDLTAVTATTTQVDFTPDANLGAGTHTLYVQEGDDAGNWSASCPQ